jgi:hypothetical protein
VWSRRHDTMLAAKPNGVPVRLGMRCKAQRLGQRFLLYRTGVRVSGW